MSSRQDIYIDQGSTFTLTISLYDANNEPLNVSGLTARSKIKKHHTSSNSVSFSVNTASGDIVLSLNANTTSQLIPGRYVYDVELTKITGDIERVVEGVAQVMPGVTLGS